jgi:hypothetical protein
MSVFVWADGIQMMIGLQHYPAYRHGQLLSRSGRAWPVASSGSAATLTG